MKRYHGTSQGRQGGVALMVALIVLVIIGLTSAAVMRGSLTTDMIANNARTQTLAMQAAQIGLRYCEDELIDNPATSLNVLNEAADDAHAEWRTYASWAKEGVVNTIPRDYLESAHGSFTLAEDQLPQCMVQWKTIGTKKAYEVTARGFSPDYDTDEKGFTKSGSVMWLQSIFYLAGT